MQAHRSACGTRHLDRHHRPLLQTLSKRAPLLSPEVVPLPRRLRQPRLPAEPSPLLRLGLVIVMMECDCNVAL